jgi:hypothetical protein
MYVHTCIHTVPARQNETPPCTHLVLNHMARISVCMRSPAGTQLDANWHWNSVVLQGWSHCDERADLGTMSRVCWIYM